MKHLPPSPRVDLKIGAQVLLLANLGIAAGLLNGSRGVVVTFVGPEEEGWPDLADGKSGKSWRDEMPEAFVEAQEEKKLPLVVLACGVKSACAFLRQAWCGILTSAAEVVRPHLWVVEIDAGNSVARTQMPLALGGELPTRSYAI